MPDTIRGDWPNADCADCDNKSSCMQHWGPLVPRGERHNFCADCWSARQDHYLRTGEVLRIGYRKALVPDDPTPS